MSDYLEINFTDTGTEKSAILIALLDNIGFEGFEETQDSLKAYIPADQFDGVAFDRIMSEQRVAFSRRVIRERNWNKEWESNFQPIVVGGSVAIRADFHSKINDVPLEIIITPKMSFGTGHHATTCLMIENMLTLDFAGKAVLDFGTGTGILAILASKLGASDILATDNDKWSIDNASENFERNGISAITLQHRDHVGSTKMFDVILANINKHIILQNLESLSNVLNPGGQVLLSGLLTEDSGELRIAAGNCGLQVNNTIEKDNWLYIRLSRR